MNSEKITILLADDDDDDRYIFNSALKELHINAQLLNFSNGEDVINYFKSNIVPPDFIFLDINMPKSDGIECLKFIKKIHSADNAAIIMLSTASAEEIIALARRHGATAYIEKPNHITELVKYLAYCFHELKNAALNEEFLLNARLKNT